MFIQFDRINRHQTKPQTRRAKAVPDDGTFQNALEQVEAPPQATTDESEKHKEPETAPDYRIRLCEFAQRSQQYQNSSALSGDRHHPEYCHQFRGHAFFQFIKKTARI